MYYGKTRLLYLPGTWHSAILIVFDASKQVAQVDASEQISHDWWHPTTQWIGSNPTSSTALCFWNSPLSFVIRQLFVSVENNTLNLRVTSEISFGCHLALVPWAWSETTKTPSLVTVPWTKPLKSLSERNLIRISRYWIWLPSSQFYFWLRQLTLSFNALFSRWHR